MALSPNWQPSDAAKPYVYGGTQYSGLHSAVALSGSLALVMWAESTGSTYSNTDTVKIRARTVSLDGANTLGTPFDIGWTSPSADYAFPYNWYSFSLSSGKVVTIFDWPWTGGTYRTYILLLGADGILIDSYFETSGTAYGVGIIGAGMSPDGTTLFVLKRNGDGDAWLLLGATFSPTISVDQNATGLTIGTVPWSYVCVTDSNVALIRTGGYYTEFTRSGATISGGTTTALNISGEYFFCYVLYAASVAQRATDGGFYVLGVRDSEPDDMTIAHVTVSSGGVTVDSATKFPSPSGGWIKNYYSAFNMHVGSFSGNSYYSNWTTMVGSKPAVAYWEDTDTGAWTSSVGVYTFNSDLSGAERSASSVAFYLDSTITAKFPSLDQNYYQPAFIPVVGSAGTLLVGQMGFNDTDGQTFGWLQFIGSNAANLTGSFNRGRRRFQSASPSF
jgi:hypothetical protein